ncbi:MAG: hypothetical protein ABH840_00475 [Nanoarchaeota archaeon]
MEVLEQEVQKAFDEGFDTVRKNVGNDNLKLMLNFLSDDYSVKAERVFEDGEIKSYLVFSRE